MLSRHLLLRCIRRCRCIDTAGGLGATMRHSEGQEMSEECKRQP